MGSNNFGLRPKPRAIHTVPSTLTPKGADLKPVLGALARWGMRHVPKTQASKGIVAALRARLIKLDR